MSIFEKVWTANTGSIYACIGYLDLINNMNELNLILYLKISCSINHFG